ncbi:MAG: HPF/RaiA family ribosome-associated protein [Candidatus Portnoybacteria bacterium]|nr:HPF/RaiA family ribosome-associated protein [Candidatus Portnoybacteria bacterium]
MKKKFPKKFLRWETQTGNLYAAIDSAQEELESEIKKFKEKKETLLRRGSRSFKKSLHLSPMSRFRKK